MIINNCLNREACLRFQMLSKLNPSTTFASGGVVHLWGLWWVWAWLWPSRSFCQDQVRVCVCFCVCECEREREIESKSSVTLCMWIIFLYFFWIPFFSLRIIPSLRKNISRKLGSNSFNLKKNDYKQTQTKRNFLSLEEKYFWKFHEFLFYFRSGNAMVHLKESKHGRARDAREIRYQTDLRVNVASLAYSGLYGNKVWLFV